MKTQKNKHMVPIPEPTSLIISEIPEANRVEISIFGELEEPVEYAHELVMLNDLSKRYPICYVYINTPGGSLMTCLQLMSYIKNFSHVVTIATGEAASAGFILWSLGDVRVADSYTSFMAHRESFGSYGKTQQHLNISHASERLYTELYRDTVDKFLTEDEVRDSKVTEVWLTADDLINRGHAISMQTFTNPGLTIVNSKIFTVVDNENNNELFFVYLEDEEHPDGGAFFMLSNYELSPYYVDNLTLFAAGAEHLKSTEDLDINPEEDSEDTITLTTKETSL
jgi:ATP-dependent protease ClpP protease subunit